MKNLFALNIINLSNKKLINLIKKKKKKTIKEHTFRQSRFIEEELIARIKITLIKNNLLPPILDKGILFVSNSNLIIYIINEFF